MNLRRAASSDFQFRVLAAVAKIPRGKAASYKKVAEMAGARRACRAVGRALAGNPFLVVIPCHRVVCADGKPGGFKKGAKLKKKLLAKEGVKFDGKGRVLNRFFV